MKRAAVVEGWTPQEVELHLRDTAYGVIGDDGPTTVNIEGEDVGDLTLEVIRNVFATFRVTLTEVEAEQDEDEFTSCGNPGPHGCQQCDACANWGCDEYHRRVDEGRY